jgi:TonB family protein
MRSRLTLCLPLLLLLASWSPGQDLQWTTFNPASDEFSVVVPVTPKGVGDRDANSSRKYFGEVGGTYLYVFSDPKGKPNNLSMISDFAAASGSRPLPRTAGSGASPLIFEDKDGYWHNIVLLNSKTRTYVAQTVSKTKDDPVATRFITSFRLGPNQSSVADNEAPAKPVPVERLTDKTGPAVTPEGRERGSGSGRGSDSGSAGGIGDGQVTSPPPTPAPGVTKGIRILTKPRPGYTNLARFYEISGSVIVRVTFKDSGEIGSISVVEGLPFGLINQAIEAAKRIRFEPAYRDGKPITVVKQVHYSFLIY